MNKTDIPLRPDAAPDIQEATGTYRYPDKLGVDMVYGPGLDGAILISPLAPLPSTSPRLCVTVPKVNNPWTLPQLWEAVRLRAWFFDAGADHGREALKIEVRGLIGDDVPAPLPFWNIKIDTWKVGPHLVFAGGDQYEWTLVGTDWTEPKIEAMCRVVALDAFRSGTEFGRQQMAAQLRAALEPPEKTMDGLSASLLDQALGPPGRSEMRHRLRAMRRLGEPPAQPAALLEWVARANRAISGAMADLDRLIETQDAVEMDAVVRLAIRSAIRSFGGEDGLFNRAGFQTAIGGYLGVPDVSSSTAHALLSSRPDVEALKGSAHYRWLGFQPQDPA